MITRTTPTRKLDPGRRYDGSSPVMGGGLAPTCWDGLMTWPSLEVFGQLVF